MKRLKLRGSGIDIPVMSLGTWAFGSDAIWGKTDEAEAAETVRRAVQTGIVQIDTAPSYGMGKSEEILGRAMKGIREQVILSTKCGLSWGERNEGQLHVERDGYRIVRNLSAECIRRDLESSLKRLQTEYVDIYYIHYPVEGPHAVPVGETMDELNRMKKEGKIRAIGVSNVTPALLEEYCANADVEIIQEKYSLLDRRAENGLLAACRERNIVLQAYSPLEQGALTERFRQDRGTPQLKRFASKPWGRPACHERLLQMLDGWSDLCGKYQCGPEHLAIAWILKQGDVNVLCGARKVSHLESDLCGADIELTAEETARIRRDAEAFCAG